MCLCADVEATLPTPCCFCRTRSSNQHLTLVSTHSRVSFINITGGNAYKVIHYHTQIPFSCSPPHKIHLVEQSDLILPEPFSHPPYTHTHTHACLSLSSAECRLPAARSLSGPVKWLAQRCTLLPHLFTVSILTQPFCVLYCFDDGEISQRLQRLMILSWQN